ncbi:MAG: IS1634 family transposase [Deltaproteobacteria bacterium]|jgi:transposase|nr:IS1634 family transposase [Deltaproteobacteria bacterium]
MPSYFVDSQGAYCYIKQSTSYWDKEIKKSRSKQICIGKIDKETGHITLYPEFIESSTINSITIKGQIIDIHSQHNYLKSINDKYRESIRKGLAKHDDINGDYIESDNRLFEPLTYCPIEIHSFKNFGGSYFIKQIAEQINLLDILKEVFPKKWQFILNIVFFLLLENKKMSHCEYFVKNFYSLPNLSMKSQRISDFLDHIKLQERDKFYKKWINILQEDEFIALDITSISSESEYLEEVAFGHNKENNKLKQFNLCMLFGEKSYMPMYQTIYHGSLNDNITLKNTIIEFSGIIGHYNFKLVMDRGFYSKENVEYLLSKKGLKFIVGVPFTTNYAKKLVDSVYDSINNMNNYIKTSTNGDNIKGMRCYINFENQNLILPDTDEDTNFNKQNLLSVYVYFNVNKKMRESNLFCKKLADIKKEILNNQKININHKHLVKQFLDIKYSDDQSSIVNININQKKVDEHLKYCGYSVLLSNDDLDASKLYITYVKKDVVEKSFHNYKTYIGLDRPYIHGNKRLLNKSFIMQICQIIYCRIHKIMQEKDLYDKFSVPKLLSILNELKSFSIKDNEFIRPITALQRMIYKKFDIMLPKVDKNNKIIF